MLTNTPRNTQSILRTDVISNIGFTLSPDQYEAQSINLPDNQVKCWTHIPQQRQYIEENTGEVMYKDEYLPKPEIEYLVSERIDLDKN
jgi:hypothetical protein